MESLCQRSLCGGAAGISLPQPSLKGREKGREFSLYYPNNIRDNKQRTLFFGMYAEGKTNSDTQRVSAEN